MSKIAVVWVALGTPDTPTPRDVRRYLREFLTDRRIVEMNPVAWRAILEAFILPRRSRVSADKYASVWYDQGSALLIHTRDQVAALSAALAQEGVDARVEAAMRYGQPSIACVLDQLRADGIRQVLIAPAYPHYSQTTVGSVYDAVARYMLASRDQLELRFVRSFPTHPMYIEALARRIEATWQSEGRPDFSNGDVLLLSYHGIPVAMAEAGDPYPTECEATTQALRTRLGLDETACRMTFQSKFGPSDWLTPATIDTVAKLGLAGVPRVDVVCPGFAADCLETLEEIGILNREAYFNATGHTGKFVRIPCLNDDPAFISTLSKVVRTNLAGWVEEPDEPGQPHPI
ncbi:MAG: ferrochelatase [Propionibacteriaceae bacterium]|nr:ferrochelatase [Propionibacteriaceae bacterium]